MAITIKQCFNLSMATFTDAMDLGIKLINADPKWVEVIFFKISNAMNAIS